MSSHCKEISACFALSLALLSGGAHAGDESKADTAPLDVPPQEDPYLGRQAPIPAPPKLQRRWYGYQILIPTIVFDALTVSIAAYSGIPELSILPFAARGLTGPLVHGLHGHGEKAWASVGLELGGGLLGLGMFGAGFLLTALHEYDTPLEHAPYTALIIAGPVLLVTGTIVDVAFVANEDVPRQEASKTGAKVLPYVAPIFLRDERSGERKPGISFGLAGYL